MKRRGKGAFRNLQNGVLNQYIIDLENVPEIGDIVPAVMCAWSKDGSCACCPAALKIPERVSYTELPSGWRAWGAAALTLATKKFGSTCTDKANAEAKIAYWLARGTEQKGFIPDDADRLPLIILHRWHYWQSEQFKAFVRSKRLTEWGARVETIREAGYKTPLTMERLKTTCHRMFRQAKTGNDGEAIA